MKIGTREIGGGHPPYIIAEVGANHGGDLGRALRLVECAKAAGADAVKFQCYTADTITIDGDRPEFTIAEGPWSGWKLYDLYKRCETPFDWFPKLAEHARKCRIDWFASAFDESAVDVLDQLDSVAIKVASFEIVDLPLIKYAARTGRPLILSTGMANHEEIDAAVSMAHSGFRQDIAVLHCVSGYPTPIEQADLAAFAEKRALLRPHPVGISDHSIGIEVPVAATALGATIIEKHMTFGSLHTPDSEFSMMPAEFHKMIVAINSIWQATQHSFVKPESERGQEPLRPSLYAVEDIAAGEPFTHENVRSIRPGAGLPPKEIDRIIGRRAHIAIGRGTPMSWLLVDGA